MVGENSVKKKIATICIFIISMLTFFAGGYLTAYIDRQNELDRISTQHRHEVGKLRGALKGQRISIDQLERSNKQLTITIGKSKKSIENSIENIKQVKLNINKSEKIGVLYDREIDRIRKSISDFREEIERAGEN